MKYMQSTGAALGAALLVAACGGGFSDPAGSQNANPGRGDLVQTPPVRVISMSAADLTDQLAASGAAGQSLLQLATGSASGPLPCGVDVHYLQYGTVGGKGEATQATAALMVPTGSAPGCSGPRPMVVYAHGTAVEQRYNLADFIDASNPARNEQNLISSQLAAKGYIVVAPNYAGYDQSTLPYHPFLVKDQQSKDMIDALKAARSALTSLLSPTTDNGKLFLTGISEGGYVAMATFEAMRTLGMAVTAFAPIEPVTAPLDYADYILSGHVPAASTQLIPMLITGYQKTYGTIYSTPSDYYTPAYASGIEAAFPGVHSFDQLFSNSIVPAAALFSGGAATEPAAWAPLFAAGVGANNLISDDARYNYLADSSRKDTHPNPSHALRVKLQANDMTRPVFVDRPMLLCGGSQDPTVFYSVNAEKTAIALASNPFVKLLDLENAYPLTSSFSTVSKLSPTDDPAVAALQGGFALAKAATQAAAPADPLAVIKKYHGSLVPAFCLPAARGFFDQF